MNKQRVGHHPFRRNGVKPSIDGIRCLIQESPCFQAGEYVKVGIPYLGKTSFVATHEWLAKLPQVSLDREVMLLANGDYSYWEKCVPEASRRCEEYQEELIRTRQSFVIDKTNLVHTAREKLISRLRQRGYQIVAIVLNPPNPQTLKERVKKRKGQVVPTDVQQKMLDLFNADKHWLLSEFDAVLYVSQTGEIHL